MIPTKKWHFLLFLFFFCHWKKAGLRAPLIFTWFPYNWLRTHRRTRWYSHWCANRRNFARCGGDIVGRWSIIVRHIVSSIRCVAEEMLSGTGPCPVEVYKTCLLMDERDGFPATRDHPWSFLFHSHIRILGWSGFIPDIALIFDYILSFGVFARLSCWPSAQPASVLEFHV